MCESSGCVLLTRISHGSYVHVPVLQLSIANLLTRWRAPDIQALTGSIFSSQTHSFSGNSQRNPSHVWRWMSVQVLPMPLYLSSSFRVLPCLQRLFPEKLSRCQWLPAVSEAVVKKPCVRLPLATVTTVVIIILAVFNLVGNQQPKPQSAVSADGLF